MVFAAGFFLSLSLVAVTLRAYVRIKLTKTFSVDDYLIVSAFIIYVFSCSFIFTGCSVGLGRHNDSLDQRHEIEALKV